MKNIAHGSYNPLDYIGVALWFTPVGKMMKGKEEVKTENEDNNNDRRTGDEKSKPPANVENAEGETAPGGEEEAYQGGDSGSYNTINQGLKGQNHPVTEVPFNEKAIEVNGEKVKGVFPEFKSLFDAQLSPDKFTSCDYKQFKESTQQLKEAISKDPSLKEKFTEEQLRDIENEEPYIDDLIWHHKEAPKFLILPEKTYHIIIKSWATIL